MNAKVTEWLSIRRRGHLKSFLRMLRAHDIFAPTEPEELAMDTMGLLASDLAMAHARIDLLEQAVREMASRDRRMERPETVSPSVLN